MFLKTVSLQNFRNYSKKEFEFDGQTTLVVGPNTSGKTNLLEAIYLLATGRSFRAEVEAEMIGYGEEVARVKCQITDGCGLWVMGSGSGSEGEDEERRTIPILTTHPRLTTHNSSPPQNTTQLEIILTTGSVSGKKVAKKRYLVNGVSRRMIDFVGQLKAVYFGPEDLQLVTDSPSLRRKYLDMVLSQVDREYRRANLSYEKGVRQRNKILEEIQRYKDTKIQSGEIRRRLYFWDQLLVKNGNYITEKREDFVKFLNSLTKLLNSNLVGGGEEGKEGKEGKFKLEYVESVISPAALEENFEKEVRLGMTLVGPHRDDIKFVTRDTRHETREKKKSIPHTTYHIPHTRDLSIYGSRGEQRLVVLWLKMGELEFISSKTETRPILLLDDIFSELDGKHREVVLGVVGKQQTIITTTDEGMVEKNEREKMQVVHLS